MVSQNKLIKEGIRYTDALFEEISKRLEQGVRSSDTLEEFLEKTKEYTKANPLATSEYDKTMLNLILSETNNHRFSRPAQKELVRVTIEEKVGEKIHDVGEDIKDSVRDIVKHGYNNNLPQEKIAENISNRVSSIKNRRARAIARTEIARAATVSDFVINKERGATGWYVECRNTACPVCKKAWHKKWTPENDDSFTPSDKTAGGKGWVGDKVYSMEDTRSLPPVHPNCYDSETQVFTDNGWKYFKDVTETDKFLSLNPMTNETEFLEPVKLIQVPNVHGKLYHIHNKWFDVCVTPDHDCFIHQRRDGGNRGRYFEPQFRKPSELSSESRFVRCIDTDRENPEHVNVNGLEFAPEDYAFFMAWYISEGSVLHNPETAKSKNYPIKITQEIDANREIIEPVFRNIAEYLGIKLYIGKQYFEFHSKALHDYLVQLGKSHEKYIPKEVFILNKECLNIFLDVYVLGDGHERNHGKYGSIERAVFTSSKRLRDDLSYLILLCGYYPSIALHTKAGTVTTHKNGAYTQKNDVYSIRINNSQYTTFSSCTVDEIDYSDLVYCVELPKYHTLWVMRNGKTSWNGNCRCVVYYVADSKGRVSTKPFTKPATDTPVTGGELPIPTSTNSMLKGKPTISHEIDGNGHKVTVYTYENGLKLAISERADFTFEEITAHIESLPEPLKNIETLNRIDIVGYPKKGISGEYRDIDKKIILYNTNKGSNALNTLTHELAHALDASQKVGKNYHLSLVDVYEKIVKADNKLYTYVKSNGRKRTPNKFPTDYAGRSYIKNKKRYKEALKVWEKGSKDPKFKPVNKFYTEDFAESTMLYLNPKTHSKFVKEFPNRAKYLEEIYGKPKFDKNSILSKLLQKEKDLSKQLFEDELKREEQELKFDKLSKKELDSHLNKIFNGDKRKVEAYHKLRNDERKLYSVSRAVSAGDIDILIKAGWDKSTAKKIMANPNDFLPKVNSRKRQVSNMLEKIDNLIISQL